MGLFFFPRGGSAHVARNLATALPAAGWETTMVSSSRPPHGDAARFYAGLDVRPVDGSDLSFEGAPDRAIASLDDAEAEEQAVVWARALQSAGAAHADVLHLHHLTPINEAAARVAPGVPVVGHLHGTELLMLEAIEDGAPWPHGAAWAERMRAWAASCRRLIVLSDNQVERARRLLGIDPERCVRVANGFDPELFRPRRVDKAAHWRRHLVDAPQGWRPGEEAGSLDYTAADLEAFASGPVLLYVGRFTA